MDERRSERSESAKKRQRSTSVTIWLDPEDPAEKVALAILEKAVESNYSKKSAIVLALGFLGDRESWLEEVGDFSEVLDRATEGDRVERLSNLIRKQIRNELREGLAPIYEAVRDMESNGFVAPQHAEMLNGVLQQSEDQIQKSMSPTQYAANEVISNEFTLDQFNEDDGE